LAATLPLPPRPSGEVAVLGHLPLLGLQQLGVPGTRPVHLALFELAEKYGDVMMLRFGARDVVVLSSPEALQEVLMAKGGSSASGRPLAASMQAQGLCRGLSALRPDDDWHALRAVLLRKAFSPAAVAKTGPLREGESSRIVDSLRVTAGTEVTLRPCLRKFATNVLLRWGLSLTPADSEAVELVQYVEEAWTELVDPFTTVADFVNMPVFRGQSCKRRRAIYALLEGHIAARRVCGCRGNHKDFLDELLDAQMKHGFSDSLVVSTLVELTTAGISTVANTLEWLMLLLAQFPKIQAKARGDVRGELDCFRYLDACIQETLRLKTPLFVPRRALQDISVRGFRIPAGSMILPNSYALAHQPKLWSGSSAVDNFDPERFLGPEHPLLDQLPSARPRCPFPANSSTGATAFKFLPFGVGKRFCPGAVLGLAEVRSFAAAVLDALEWRPATNAMDLAEAYSLTLTPLRPCPLIFRDISTK